MLFENLDYLKVKKALLLLEGAKDTGFPFSVSFCVSIIDHVELLYNGFLKSGVGLLKQIHGIFQFSLFLAMGFLGLNPGRTHYLHRWL